MTWLQFSSLKIRKINKKLDPFPIFLGIRLDPKLSYIQHISEKIISRTRLIRKIISLKLKNSKESWLIVFNSQIKSLLDYAFIPTISPCQNSKPSKPEPSKSSNISH
jgi:hypothetical protein